MANLLEVLVTSDSNNTLWTGCVWDPYTGTSLMTYKGGGTAQDNTLTFIGNDYLAVVEKTKPVLHIWPLNSYQTVQGIRFILPGKAESFATSHDGSYIIAGIDEKIYVWQTTSGNLLTILNRHYQKVTMLKFTPDGSYFISAGKDGMVMVWSLATVSAHPEVDLVAQTSAGHHDPVYVFSDHSHPVTGLYISKTGMHGRLCTVSADTTCLIYDLCSGELLLNITLHVELTSVTMDSLELTVFVGTYIGKIHKFSLLNPPRSRDLSLDSEDVCNTFISHTKSVNCLSVSLDNRTLVSGSSDEKVILWDIPSKQIRRIICHKGPVLNAFFTINLPAIYKQDFSPSIILHSLERTLEKDSDDITEIEVLVNRKCDLWPERHIESEFSVSTKELENEFKFKESVLQEELNRLRIINTNLYTVAVQKTLESVNVTNGSSQKKSKNKKKR